MATAPNAFREGATAGSTTAAPAAEKKTGIFSWSASSVVNTLRIANFCNGLCLATFAIIAFIPISSSSPLLSASYTTITVGAYVVVLGMFMCCVECNCNFVQIPLRRRCGFYFSYMGRAVCIFFTGTMALALISDDSSSTAGFWYTVGGVTCANAIFNLFLILCHPAFRAQHAAFSDPWSGKGAEAQAELDNALKARMAAYVKSHPEVAAKAVSAGVAVMAAQPSAVAPNAFGGKPAKDNAVANPFRSGVAAAEARNNGGPAMVQHEAAAQSDAYHLGTSYRGTADENPFK